NECLSIVQRRDKIRAPIKTGLTHIPAQDAELIVKNSDSAAQNGAGIHRIGEAETRHEVVLIHVPQGPPIAVDTRKLKTSENPELGCRDLRDWIRRIVRPRCVL